MTEQVDPTLTTILRARLEVNVEVDNQQVLERLCGLGDETPSVEDIPDRVYREIIEENMERVFDAMHEQLDRGEEVIDDVDVEDWNQESKRTRKVELVKADIEAGEFYMQPTPSFVSGLVTMGSGGIEPMTRSPLNQLNDDQLQGYMFALDRVWGLRGMGVYQKTQIAELMSESNWTAMSRPTQHTYLPRAASPDLDQCRYCNQPADQHARAETINHEVCGDEFCGNVCDLDPDHDGDHGAETDAGRLTWSDPMDTPPGEEEE